VASAQRLEVLVVSVEQIFEAPVLLSGHTPFPIPTLGVASLNRLLVAPLGAVGKDRKSW
jgi:hypothetical protein